MILNHARSLTLTPNDLTYRRRWYVWWQVIKPLTKIACICIWAYEKWRMRSEQRSEKIFITFANDPDVCVCVCETCMWFGNRRHKKIVWRKRHTSLVKWFSLVRPESLWVPQIPTTLYDFATKINASHFTTFVKWAPSTTTTTTTKGTQYTFFSFFNRNKSMKRWWKWFRHVYSTEYIHCAIFHTLYFEPASSGFLSNEQKPLQ